MQFKKYVEGNSNDLKVIKHDDLVKSIDFLIEDENEAIRGYDEIILLIENTTRPDKNFIIKKLKLIREQELEHIRILKNLL